MKAGSACAAGLLALLGCVAQAVHAQAPSCPPGNQWPAKIRIEYDVTASRGPLSISGESVLVFERTGSAYTIRIDTDSTAIYHATQTSRGTIEKSGLRPLEFTEKRGSRAQQSARFDWDAKRVSFSAAPDRPVPTQPGLQDRASLLIQLAWQHRSITEASFEVPVAGTRRVGPYRFVRQGNETVKAPAGSIDAVRVERTDDGEDRLEAWLGVGWCGLPVRIRFTDRNGGVIDHRVRAAQIE